VVRRPAEPKKSRGVGVSGEEDDIGISFIASVPESPSRKHRSTNEGLFIIIDVADDTCFVEQFAETFSAFETIRIALLSADLEAADAREFGSDS